MRLDEARWWRVRVTVARWGKRVGLPIVAAALVIGAIALGVAMWQGGGEAPANPDAADGAVTPSQHDPVDAARQLTLARFDALSSRDGEALVGLTVEGSLAWEDAQGTGAALASGALRVEGLVGVVETADVVETDAGGAATAPVVIRVRYRLGPHTVVNDGTATEYEGYVQMVDLTLVWVDDEGWLVSEAIPTANSTEGFDDEKQAAQDGAELTAD
jgi:hypothetical protein